MALADELQGIAIQAQAAAAKQGDTVRSLKASLKDGKAGKVSGSGQNMHLLCFDVPVMTNILVAW